MSLNLDRSTWRRVKFGDVVRNVNVNVKDPAAEGIQRVIGLEHLDPGELRIERWGDLTDETTFTRRVRPGQTLFGKRRAYQRKTAYAEFDAICSGDILVFESADPTALLPELLPFVAMTDAFYAKALETSAGSLSPRTKWAEVAKYEFDLPPLDDQGRIADLLWAVDGRLQSLCKLAERVLAVGRAESSRWFSGQDGSSAAVLGAVCQKLTVGVVVKPTQYYATTGVPALRSLNVKPGGFVLDDLVYFSPDAHAELRKSALEEGDVVVVRTGRPGDAAVVNEEVAGSNAIDLIIVRPGDSLDSEFLCRYLNSDVGRQAVGRGSAGTAQQHFNVGALSRLSVPMPPIAKQHEFVRRMGRFDDVARGIQAESEECRRLRGAVLSRVWGADQ